MEFHLLDAWSKFSNTQHDFANTNVTSVKMLRRKVREKVCPLRSQFEFELNFYFVTYFMPMHTFSIFPYRNH